MPLQPRGGLFTPAIVSATSPELQMLEPDAQWDSELREVEEMDTDSENPALFSWWGAESYRVPRRVT